MSQGRVIILNGVSSAGKTTLAKAIQRASKPTWLHIAMDGFMAMLPEGREFWEEWYPVLQISHGRDVLPRIAMGPKGGFLLGQMRRTVENMASDGFDIVVDDVADAEAIADYRARLANCLVVKVDAPLEELEIREKARGDRLIGLAREQSSHLHDGTAYDLEVDTHAEDTIALASRILQAAGS